MNEIEYKTMFDAEGRHWWYVGLHDLIVSFLQKQTGNRRALNIFDAGCGTGRLMQILQGFGRVSGCDISDIAIGYCRIRNLPSAFQADLNTAELGRDCFDVITSIDVLYHKGIHNDALVIEKFYKALKPGGILIINLPAYNFLRSSHDIAVHTKKRYTKKELLALLEKAGFDVMKISYRISFLFPPIFLCRLGRSFLLKKTGKNEHRSDVDFPPDLVNKFLIQINIMENYFLEKLCLPFGSSVFAVAVKPGLIND